MSSGCCNRGAVVYLGGSASDWPHTGWQCVGAERRESPWVGSQRVEAEAPSHKGACSMEGTQPAEVL